VQQPVGEDVTALGIGAELDFVHRHEGGAQVERHRLHRADEILGLRGHDLFFTGDKRGELFAFHPRDAVVHLAGEQPERQPDHARAVRQHPLDGEVGLAGVGGAQNGGNAAEAFGPHRPTGHTRNFHDSPNVGCLGCRRNNLG
jgi:hypothetical protein